MLLVGQVEFNLNIYHNRGNVAQELSKPGDIVQF